MDGGGDASLNFVSTFLQILLTGRVSSVISAKYHPIVAAARGSRIRKKGGWVGGGGRKE